MFNSHIRNKQQTGNRLSQNLVKLLLLADICFVLKETNSSRDFNSPS